MANRNMVELVKSTHFYQRYYCGKYYQSNESKADRNISFRKAFFQVRPAYYSRREKDFAVKRIKKVFAHADMEADHHSVFYYSLDEKSMVLYRDSVIGNAPVDYSLITQGSLAGLKNQAAKYDNIITRQNLKLIEIIENQIDRIVSKINDQRIAAALTGLKDRPAADLFEALQRILFINQILWQTGHKLLGLGRLDKILDVYEADDEAEELLSQFMIALHSHYVFKSNTLVGDTGQIIVLGGLEKNGMYFSNRYTELFMHCLAELHLPDPKILLRVSKIMPQHLLTIATDSIATGLGCPLLSNDDVIIPLLMDFGYSEEDAYNYGVSACWEPLSIGNSLEQNNLFNIQFAQVLLNALTDEHFISAGAFDDLLNLYMAKLRTHIQEIEDKLNTVLWEKDPLFTLFTDGCLESGKDISEGGAVYSDYGLLSVGLATCVNSLINIKHFVFDQRLVKKEELINCLKSNYEGFPHFEKLFSQNTEKFGKDDELAVSLTQQIISTVSEELSQYSNRFGGKTKFGLSSPDYINYGLKTGATPDGRKKGDPFATHISCDGNNALLDVVHFACGLHFDALSCNGNVVDSVIQPAVIRDKEKFLDYIMGCIRSGVFQTQFNILSYEQLVDAKQNPGKYPGLIVRVWGFSAYFNDLPDDYKDTLIKRAKMAEDGRM